MRVEIAAQIREVVNVRKATTEKLKSQSEVIDVRSSLGLQAKQDE
jgi:hypothetical protein